MANISSQDRINERLSPSTTKKGGKGPFIAVASTAVVLILIICVLVLGKEKAITGKNVVVTPDNVEDIIKEMEGQRVAPGTYEVKMNPEWTFKNATAASSNAYVENAANNTNDVYFTLSYADTKEVFHTSPVIPIGSRIANIALDSSLPKGTTDCIITYHLLDNNREELSSVNLTLSITIEN